MFGKFAEAINLLKDHFILFSSILLTVWLPGNLLSNALYYSSGEEVGFGFIRAAMMIEGVFGPIYIGALVYALFRIKSGHAVTYGEAIKMGIKKWGALFAARFISGILIFLGFLLLIIPGIVLAVRYALLDSAVVLEGANPNAAMKRSTDLTAGRRWEIFGAGTILITVVMLLSFFIYLPTGFVLALDNMWVGTFLDCFVDISFLVIQITMFLYYWELAVGPQLPDNSGIEA